MAESGQGWVLALGTLSALLVAAATSAVLFMGSIMPRLNQGISFTGENDPARAEWIRLQTLSQVLTMLGPFLTIAAGLSVVALLFVLARRWDAKFAYGVVDSV